jgi:hypothetical protein
MSKGWNATLPPSSPARARVASVSATSKNTAQWAGPSARHWSGVWIMPAITAPEPAVETSV